MMVASVWALADPPERRAFEVKLCVTYPSYKPFLPLLPSYHAQSGIDSRLFSDLYVSQTLQWIISTDILNERWLPKAQTSNPFWMEPGCSVSRPNDHVLPWSFMTEPKENTQTAWPRSCTECDHSNLVSSLHFITCEMRLMHSWLQSEPESDCVINTSEDCQS